MYLNIVLFHGCVPRKPYKTSSVLSFVKNVKYQTDPDRKACGSESSPRGGIIAEILRTSALTERLSRRLNDGTGRRRRTALAPYSIIQLWSRSILITRRSRVQLSQAAGVGRGADEI